MIQNVIYLGGYSSFVWVSLKVSGIYKKQKNNQCKKGFQAQLIYQALSA